MSIYSTYISNIKNLSDEQKEQVVIIARYFNSSQYRKDIRLCPSNDLLNAYKTGSIDWDDYVVDFKELMKQKPMLTALRELYGRCKEGEDIILVCYEKSNERCHRRLIGEFLESYGIEYKEL